MRALVKLQQVLPSRLRHRVGPSSRASCRCRRAGPQVDPDVLTVIASACRDHERLRFDYRAHDGRPPAGARSSRTAWSTTGGAGTWWPGTLDRDDWRTFRVDRIDAADADRTAVHAAAATARSRDRGQVAAGSARPSGGTGHG